MGGGALCSGENGGYTWVSKEVSLKNKFYDKFLLVIIDLDSRVTITNISVHTEVKIYIYYKDGV